MSIIKVVVATEWTFSEPQEVADRFRQTPVGKDMLVEYDDQNHCFLVNCPMLDSYRVCAALQDVIKAYVLTEQARLQMSDDPCELPKVKSITDADFVAVNQQHIWDIVDQIEATSNNPRSEQLIAQIIKWRVVSYSPHEIHKVFTVDTLRNIAKATNCEVTIDSMSRRIKIVGWEQPEVARALELLVTVEEQYDAKLQKMVFDFFNDEGQIEIAMRFVRPTNVIDPEPFQDGQPPLCELTMVEWVPDSRQWKIARKQPTTFEGLALDVGETLWARLLCFKHTRKENEPQLWPLVDSHGLDGYGYLSKPQIGRTLRWTAQIPERPLDPNTNVEVNALHVPSTGVNHTRTKRVRRVHASASASEKRFLSSNRQELVSAQGHDERLQQLSDVTDRIFVSAGKLGAPGRSNLVSGEQWPWVRSALSTILESAQWLHGTALSFELYFGRIYVHTISIAPAQYRPRKGMPAHVFDGSKWPELFRVREKDKGASTVFSKKLTTSTTDASCLLTLKLKGGEYIFEALPRHSRVFFELLCRDNKTGAEAVLEFMEDGTLNVDGAGERLASINFHYPANIYDVSMHLTSRKKTLRAESATLFKALADSVYIGSQQSADEEPVFYCQRGASLEIHTVRLVRESVHRCGRGPSLCLAQVKVCDMHNIGVQHFKATVPVKEVLLEDSRMWWEAKLISSHLQRALAQNIDLPLGGRASWHLNEAEVHLQQMLEVAGHVIPKIDKFNFLTQASQMESSSTVQQT